MAEPGRLDLILGSMFSGKTTRLIGLYNEFKNKNINVIAVNFADDTRYHKTMLSTHDNVMIPCIQCHSLNEILHTADVKNSSVILINEGQFFQDIFEVSVKLVETLQKHVVICGLDGDFKRIKFGRLCDLIPFCDSIIKLHASCSCGEKAIFSHRITNEVEQVVIGSSNYIPLCRTCYIHVNNLSTVDCTSCHKHVLLSDTQPFINDRFICEACVDPDSETYHVYQFCNKCDKFYYASSCDWDMNEVAQTTDYDYDGDVCHLCLPEIMKTYDWDNRIDIDDVFCLSSCSENDDENKT